jgi:adenosylcobinamide-GDP ribazoletransferase
VNAYRGFIVALQTLTIIPVPVKVREAFSSSLYWFPVVGLALGLFLWVIARVWINILPEQWPGGGALILLVGQIILTGGLHLDGLADWADALGSASKGKVRLFIMKDAHVGSFAVFAVTAVLLAKWVALERLLSNGLFIWLLPVMVISRSMMVALITTLPYARGGEGTAHPFFQGACPRHKFVSYGVALMICGIFGLSGLVLFLSGWIVIRFLSMSFLKGFGGVTGDLLGATNEITEGILLLVAAAAGEQLSNHAYWGPVLS